MADPAAKASSEQEKASARGTQSNPDSKPDEVRYTRDQLEEQAPNLLGVPGHAIPGALEGEDAKTFTLKRAETLVNKFLSREVEGQEVEAS